MNDALLLIDDAHCLVSVVSLLPGFSAETLDGRAAGFEFSRDLRERHAVEKLLHCVGLTGVGKCGPAAQLRPLGACESSLSALDEQIPFKFGDGGQHLHRHTARWRAQVDAVKGETVDAHTVVGPAPDSRPRTSIALRPSLSSLVTIRTSPSSRRSGSLANPLRSTAATDPETPPVTMRRLLMANPALWISITWLSVV